jgi:PAS domain S-box-containing protein
MSHPQKTSIKRKVIAVIMLASIGVLLVTVTAFMIYDLVTFRQTMERNLGTQARMIAENSTAALAFRNESDAENVLSSLQAEPHIIAAAIYDAQGKLFVKYPAQIPDADLPDKPQDRSYKFGKSHLTIFQPVVQSGTQLGTIFLRSDVTALSQRLELYGAISFFIMAGSLLVAFWLSHTLQRRISDPVIALAGTARKISEQQDYSLRAPKLSDDELGFLTDSFNNMLEQIQAGNSALRASEAQFRLVTDQAKVALAQLDREVRYKFANRIYAERYGYQPHEIIGKHAGEIVGAALFEVARPYIEKTLAGEQIQFELEFQDTRLGQRWSHAEYTPEKNSAGQVIGFVVAHTDITERKLAGEVSRRLAAIVESSVDAIVSKDTNGIITSWNQGAEQLFGYPPHEVIGQPVTILMPLERRNEEPGILERIRRGERIEHYETIRQRKDGKLIEISLTVSPIRDATGKVIGASKIARDISQQKQAERELERAHKEAVAASRAKDDFLAALSHELRTPLNPVLLVASDAANNPQLSKETRDDFDMIRRNVELEARLIDDLLDLTRITRGKLSLEKSSLDLRAVLQDAIAIVRADAEKKQIGLTFDFGADQHMILGDAVRLQQIFWNVLKNAVKFTPEGGKIKVETRTLAESGKIAVKIIDTGIGLTAGEISHIFNAFSQGDHALSSGTHRFGGLGLGLTISRMLVELHSGVIQAVSAGRDQGATFTIEFPNTQVEEENNNPMPPEPLPTTDPQTGSKAKSGRRILLVEDHEPTRTALAHLLARRDYKVMTANSVAEAQALVRQETFDLVVSDIGLPDGNGYTLMSELRDNFGLKGIALTGYGMEQDVARGQSAGFVAHLTKPVRVESLERALSKLI